MRPQFHFDYKNFKVSLIIKKRNLSGILKMTHLTMLCHVLCECDYLSKF